MWHLITFSLALASASSMSYFSYSGGQPGSSGRFVHFTNRLSVRNINFQPLFGSLQVR